MTIIRKAERKKAKLRLGVAAPSGAGKTYSSLLLAFGIGGKVGLIDTENGSGDLYAHLGDYDIINIAAPFEAKKYADAIAAFEDAGYDTFIIDSLSQAWAGDGGLLDKQGRVADRLKNSYTAWREVTPDHNMLVSAMLQSRCHIIATMRSKTEYVLEENEKGNKVPRKIGMAPVQREGMEYEFTVMLDIDQKHFASVSKDRTGLFDGKYFHITQETGKTLLSWLESGIDEAGDIIEAVNAATSLDELREIRDTKAKAAWAYLTTEQKAKIQEAFDIQVKKRKPAQDDIPDFSATATTNDAQPQENKGENHDD